MISNMFAFTSWNKFEISREKYFILTMKKRFQKSAPPIMLNKRIKEEPQKVQEN